MNKIHPCAWRKSSYSDADGNCVEVALQPDGIAVRDSTDPAGPVMALTTRQFAALVTAVRLR